VTGPHPSADFTRLERQLGAVLAAGVALSAGLLAVGLALWMAAGAGGALLHVGLIVLMATPVLRVVVSLVEFVRLREWLFVAATVAVLAVLAAAAALALYE
jgi:uncharacterized membrane protein